MAENTTEQIKAQKTISELLSEIGEKAEAIQKTFKKQRDAAKDVESIITAQKNKMEGFEKNRDAAAKVVEKAQQKQIDLLKARNLANEKMAELVEIKWYENQYLWLGIGFILGKI